MKAPLSILLASAAVLVSCAGEKGPKRGPEAVPVTVASVTKASVPLEVTAIGHAEAIKSVQIRPRVGGEITSVAFTEGQDVKEGDLLFTIDPRPYRAALAAAEAALERDRAKAKNAASEVARFADLVKKDYVTRQQFDAAQADAAASEAVVKVDEAAVENAKLDLSYATIKAPISGRTGSLLVKPGNIIKANADQPILVINQMEPMNVAFSVPEQALPGSPAALAARRLKVTASPAGSAPHDGVLTFVDNAVDPATGTILMKATFLNRDRGLWPGEFAQVVLTLGTENDAIVVPDEAIQTGQQGTYVFVVTAGQTAEMRPVTVARSQGGRTVVKKGLAPGENVVTDGQLRLTNGAKVEIKVEIKPGVGGKPA